MIQTQQTHQLNDDYQREFAHSLVRAVGFSAAVQTCRENLWHGILEILTQEKHDLK